MLFTAFVDYKLAWSSRILQGKWCVGSRSANLINLMSNCVFIHSGQVLLQLVMLKVVIYKKW